MRLFPILFLISFFSFGQNTSFDKQKKDSILFYLKNARDSKEIIYLKKAINISEETGNDSLIRISKIQYANAGYFRGDSIEKKKSLEELRNFYEAEKDSFALAKLLHIKAMDFKKELRLDNSFYYY